MAKAKESAKEKFVTNEAKQDTFRENVPKVKVRAKDLVKMEKVSRSSEAKEKGSVNQHRSHMHATRVAKLGIEQQNVGPEHWLQTS